MTEYKLFLLTFKHTRHDSFIQRIGLLVDGFELRAIHGEWCTSFAISDYTAGVPWSLCDAIEL